MNRRLSQSKFLAYPHIDRGLGLNGKSEGGPDRRVGPAIRATAFDRGALGGMSPQRGTQQAPRALPVGLHVEVCSDRWLTFVAADQLGVRQNRTVHGALKLRPGR